MLIGVEIETQWGGMANLFGGEGGFGLRASGDGEALVSVLLQSRNPEAFMEWVVHTVAAPVQP